MKQCIRCSAMLDDSWTICPNCQQVQNMSVVPQNRSGPGKDKIWGVMLYISPFTMIISICVYLSRIGRKTDTEFLTRHVCQALPLQALNSLFVTPVQIALIIPFINIMGLVLLPIPIFFLVFQIIGIISVLSESESLIPIFGHFAS